MSHNNNNYIPLEWMNHNNAAQNLEQALVEEEVNALIMDLRDIMPLNRNENNILAGIIAGHEQQVQEGRNEMVEIDLNIAEELDNQTIKKDLIFSPYYYVVKYTRSLKRSEVFGFGCINMSIICIALLAQIGMTALGYFPTVPNIRKPNSNHIPRSFSWKLLSEFFISNSLTNLEKDCLYFSKKRIIFRDDEGAELYFDKLNQEIDQFTKENKFQSENFNHSLDEDGLLTHLHKCTKTKIRDEWSWLTKYISTMFIPILNIVCSLIFLSSISCRRKRGVQFMLIIPAFVCFFLDIFQQIPLTFHYSYANMVLMEEMHSSLALTMPPYIISPIWEETQIHGKCCGINGPSTWAMQDTDIYPRSCCDTTTHKCELDQYPTKDKLWTKGCFQQEYETIRHFEFMALLLLLLKLLAEIGIFWSLSDLTRYDYPPDEHIQTSSCNVNDYEVRTKGCVTIRGVTEHQKMAIQLKLLVRGRVRYRVERVGQIQTVLIRNSDKLIGSIEIRRQIRLDNRNPEHPNINFTRGRKLGLIFVSFL